jgi:hypothetical protein
MTALQQAQFLLQFAAAGGIHLELGTAAAKLELKPHSLLP